MNDEEKLLNETLAFLNSADIFSQMVPLHPGSSKPYLAVWRTIPEANVFVHGMNYYVVGGKAPHECPIDDRPGLAEILVRIHKGEG